MSRASRAKAETALEACDAVLAQSPGDAVARHNRAVELRRLGRSVEALIEIELAHKAGSRAPKTALMYAHLLADAGRYDEAVDGYRTLIAHDPRAIDAHETLARLLPQIGRGAEALDSYRQALAMDPGWGALWLSALGTAKDLRDGQQLLDWGQAVETRFGPDTLVTTLRAQALSWRGDDLAALAVLESGIAADPQHQPLHSTLAHVALRLGDPEMAKASALRAAQLAPTDQTSWALLSVALRLLDDPREHWLTDYAAHVLEVDLEGVDLAATAACLTALHTTQHQPAEQSLRNGTQTRGDVFDRSDAEIVALELAIENAISTALRRVTPDPKHPFARRNTGTTQFVGAWSVRLRESGFHIDHIHPSGWLSSACYIALPPEIDGTGDAGALQFGVPDAALGLDLPPRRVVRPRAGKLVLFPSYFWHGTVPFESQQPRLTVAFDALPVDNMPLRG